MSWLETLPSLLIVVGAVGAMGSLPGVVHRAYHNGKNKRVQRDHFDHLMSKRDEKVQASGETLSDKLNSQ